MHNAIPKVIQVSEGATENLQAASVFVEIALQRFWGVHILFPSPTLKCERWSRHFRNKPQQALQC